MKSWFLQNLHNIRYSYWFIPSVMCFLAAVLAAVLVAVDSIFLAELPHQVRWFLDSDPDGARALLSTVAGSTITVAGVVFSMTIMSVSHATSNYGSRLLKKFLKDIGNQIALGTFTATFIYCLLVLRTVSGTEGGSGAEVFVPHVAVLGGLVMALLSVIVLISFIHHIPDQIDIGNLAAERGKELVCRLEEIFPKDSPADGLELPSFSGQNEISTPGAGYLQNLDAEGLANFCEDHHLRAKLLCEPGDFLLPGESVLIYDRSEILEGEDYPDFGDESLQGFFAIGQERTPSQDLRFFIEELQQTCIRALSPGINDPFTAVTCIDWMGMCVASIVGRGSPNRCIRSDAGTVRVIQLPFDKSRFVSEIFTPLRQHVASDLFVLDTCLNLLFRMQTICTDADLNDDFKTHAEQLYQQAVSIHQNGVELAQIERLWKELNNQS